MPATAPSTDAPAAPAGLLGADHPALLSLFGEHSAPDGTLARDNFARWFGRSVLREPGGRPLLFFHGTGNTAGIYERGFSYDFVGRGNDSLGSGWYFTNRQDTAQGYARRRLEPELQKLGGEESPGVIAVYLRIANPIVITPGEPGTMLMEQLPDLTAVQVRAILRQAPGIDDPEGPLINFGDTYREGLKKVFDSAVRLYSGSPCSHFTICNDFFSGAAPLFLRALSQVTGRDGMVQRFDTGEMHAVAWFPEQIKDAHRNCGAFSLDDPSIVDAMAVERARLDAASRANLASRAIDEFERAQVQSLRTLQP